MEGGREEKGKRGRGCENVNPPPFSVFPPSPEGNKQQKERTRGTKGSKNKVWIRVCAATRAKRKSRACSRLTPCPRCARCVVPHVSSCACSRLSPCPRCVRCVVLGGLAFHGRGRAPPWFPSCLNTRPFLRRVDKRRVGRGAFFWLAAKKP